MKTNSAIEILLQIRKNTVTQLLKHEEKASVIPVGYKNSLIWNAAHNLVTLQLLAYKLSGLNMHVSEEIVEKYKKGTAAKADDNIDIKELITLLENTSIQLNKDYEKGLFTEYSPYETSFGITLRSIEDVIEFNNVHESVHLGYIMAMAKNL